MKTAQVALSPIDEMRFGIRVARIHELTQETLDETLEFCRDHAVKMLIARTPSQAIRFVQQLEDLGFRLMDTLVYYRRDLVRTPVPELQNAALTRPVRTGDETVVREIAAQAFQGYLGHYHADPRLDLAACDAVYVSWAERSCVDRAVADEVLVAELEGQLVGFLTLRRNTPEQVEIVLNGVAPSAQGRGVYRELVIHALVQSKAWKAQETVVSTQIVNLAPQKVWVRLGFEPFQSYYTFHKWFD
ncbi:MAG: GNAT family N-acetyltransferase [Anaerolineae bacterium]|nr:GNAT family N-acetyltransferase [Anaerolineae bacterium]MDW8297852.1 GNAT family N-acetyltransferase [Anaerolineae bacterium]